jgi:hypothetical protein
MDRGHGGGRGGLKGRAHHVDCALWTSAQPGDDQDARRVIIPGHHLQHAGDGRAASGCTAQRGHLHAAGIQGGRQQLAHIGRGIARLTVIGERDSDASLGR